jgi:hypothetical protein
LCKTLRPKAIFFFLKSSSTAPSIFIHLQRSGRSRPSLPILFYFEIRELNGKIPVSTSFY